MNLEEGVPKKLDIEGKDRRIGKKEQAMESHVKYSAFAKTIANALYLT